MCLSAKFSRTNSLKASYEYTLIEKKWNWFTADHDSLALFANAVTHPFDLNKSKPFQSNLIHHNFLMSWEKWSPLQIYALQWCFFFIRLSNLQWFIQFIVLFATRIYNDAFNVKMLKCVLFVFDSKFQRFWFCSPLQCFFSKLRILQIKSRKYYNLVINGEREREE